LAPAADKTENDGGSAGPVAIEFPDMHSPVTDQDKKTLLELARAGVRARVLGEPPPQPPGGEGVLAARRGCFVTLTNNGQLRGCIGTFMPREPLAHQIVEMGQAAAQDPRFAMNPITAEELAELTVEVSVLSPLETTEEPEKLTPGVHGIYVVQGGRAGCFLPEVATDQGWGAEEFLSYCCAHKAGLAPDAWRQPGTQVYLFTSDKFSE
jgi:AmmeMemoRadiSam system protein A